MMKYIKTVLGLLGAIFIIPLFIAILCGIVIAVDFLVDIIFSVIFFKILGDIILWIAILSVLFIIGFCGYFGVIDVLERNFKYFKKK